MATDPAQADDTTKTVKTEIPDSTTAATPPMEVDDDDDFGDDDFGGDDDDFGDDDDADWGDDEDMLNTEEKINTNPKDMERAKSIVIPLTADKIDEEIKKKIELVKDELALDGMSFLFIVFY